VVVAAMSEERGLRERPSLRPRFEELAATAPSGPDRLLLLTLEAVVPWHLHLPAPHRCSYTESVGSSPFDA
jgi:hypothetical protein